MHHKEYLSSLTPVLLALGSLKEDDCKLRVLLFLTGTQVQLSSSTVIYNLLQLQFQETDPS